MNKNNTSELLSPTNGMQLHRQMKLKLKHFL